MRKSVLLGVSSAFALSGAACTATPDSTFHTYTLTIELDTHGCPSDVQPDPTQPDCPRDRAKKCVAKADKVKWIAAGSTRSFDVHFDPFRGRTVRGTCHRNGCETPPLTIDPAAPPSEADQGEVEYKYTLAVAGCAPLDPPIFIQR